MGAIMVIPALIAFIGTMALGLAISIAGFIFWRKRDEAKTGCFIWSVAFVATLLVLIPLICATAHLPEGEAGPPTGESYVEVTKYMAFWAVVPGVALTVGGLVQLLLLFKKKKQDTLDLPDESHDGGLMLH